LYQRQKQTSKRLRDRIDTWERGILLNSHFKETSITQEGKGSLGGEDESKEKRSKKGRKVRSGKNLPG